MTPNTKGQPSYIESATNPLVIKTAALKDRKARREQGQLLVEGRKCLEEAINAGCQIHHLFLREGEAEAFPSDHPSHNSSIPILVSEKAMKKMATTQTPPPVLATISLPKASTESFYKESTGKDLLMLVLHQLQDPGNMGSLIRSAKAFGAAGILITQGTVDPFSPKVIRASAGQVFSIPILETTTLLDTLQQLSHQKIQLLVTTVDPQAVSYRKTSYGNRCAIVLGQEGSGLPTLDTSIPLTQITIPIMPNVDSLNVAVTGAVLMAEAAAQRAQ